MTVYVVPAKYCLSICTRVMRELFLHKQNVGINSSAAIPKQQIDLLKIFVLIKGQIRNRFSVFVFSNDDNLFHSYVCCSSHEEKERRRGIQEQ